MLIFSGDSRKMYFQLKAQGRVERVILSAKFLKKLSANNQPEDLLLYLRVILSAKDEVIRFINFLVDLDVLNFRVLVRFAEKNRVSKCIEQFQGQIGNALSALKSFELLDNDVTYKILIHDYDDNKAEFFLKLFSDNLKSKQILATLVSSIDYIVKLSTILGNDPNYPKLRSSVTKLPTVDFSDVDKTQGLLDKLKDALPDIAILRYNFEFFAAPTVKSSPFLDWGNVCHFVDTNDGEEIEGYCMAADLLKDTCQYNEPVDLCQYMGHMGFVCSSAQYAIHLNVIQHFIRSNLLNSYLMIRLTLIKNLSNKIPIDSLEILFSKLKSFKLLNADLVCQLVAHNYDADQGDFFLTLLSQYYHSKEILACLLPLIDYLLIFSAKENSQTCYTLFYDLTDFINHFVKDVLPLLSAQKCEYSHLANTALGLIYERSKASKEAIDEHATNEARKKIQKLTLRPNLDPKSLTPLVEDEMKVSDNKETDTAERKNNGIVTHVFTKKEGKPSSPTSKHKMKATAVTTSNDSRNENSISTLSALFKELNRSTSPARSTSYQPSSTVIEDEMTSSDEEYDDQNSAFNLIQVGLRRL